jgi:hypothetical protein
MGETLTSREKVCFMMRVNLKFARWLLNFSVLGTAFIYFQRGVSPRLLLLATIAGLLFVNGVFSWAQRSRTSEALSGATGSRPKETRTAK